MSERLSQRTYPHPHELRVTAVVRIVEHGPSDAISRVTGADGDEWREHMYPDILTEQDVLEHWAQNAVANGFVDVCQLDGWADLEAETVTMHVDRVEPSDDV